MIRGHRSVIRPDAFKSVQRQVHRVLIGEEAQSLIVSREADFPLLTAGGLTMSLAIVALNRLVWRRLYRLAETKYSLNR